MARPTTDRGNQRQRHSGHPLFSANKQREKHALIIERNKIMTETALYHKRPRTCGVRKIRHDAEDVVDRPVSTTGRHRRNVSLPFKLMAATVVGTMVCQCSGFRVATAPKVVLPKVARSVPPKSAKNHKLGLSSSPPPRTSSMLAPTSEVAAAAHALQPRTSIPKEKRQEAYNALKRSRVESAVTGVDTQILDMLSDHFRFPVNDLRRRRPKGRPEFVPGAMNVETMSKFRTEQDVLDMVSEASVSDQEIAAIAPFILDSSARPTSQPSSSATKKAALSEITKTLPTSAAESIKNHLAKPVPPAGQRTANNEVQQIQLTYVDFSTKYTSSSSGSKRNRKVNGMDLQKYYGTALLTADEEYGLGMKIQFMMKCEQVHDGLAASLLRLPSIVEWAHACGFTDPDPTFVVAEADDQLRPAGSDSLFDETDPNMFVGNGLALSAGPGRGRGRVKKPLPTKLKDFYDDSELVAASKSNKSVVPPPSRKHLKPVNRGTVTDFVEMLMTAREAKQRMVQSNMRLVVSISRKYSKVGVSLQDLVQEGSLGLSRAAEKFDPKKGFKFSTYASWWIQQAVFRSIAYHSRTIRLPVHVHTLLNRIRKVRSALQRELSRTPTNEEIAAQLGMTVEKYNKTLRLTKRSISLEAPKYKSNPKDLGHESDDLLGDTISASNVLEDETTPEKKVDHTLFHDDLKEMLTVLDDDEMRVISARYGLADGLTRSVTAVAAQMKQSKAWVRSQECRALRKLRRPWYEKKLKEHQDALSN